MFRGLCVHIYRRLTVTVPRIKFSAGQCPADYMSRGLHVPRVNVPQIKISAVNLPRIK